MNRKQMIAAAQGVIDVCNENNESCSIADAMSYLKGENEVYGIYRLIENFNPADCREIVHHFIAANVYDSHIEVKSFYLQKVLKLSSSEKTEKALAFFRTHY